MQNTILQKIITDKYQWLNTYKKKYPLNTFKNLLQLCNKNFYKVLSGKNTKLILECKKASPSHGILCKDFNLTKIALTYSKYASVISVLTEEKFFQGHFDYLKIVSQIVTQPVLCKDFIIDPWQIYFARLHQADAILLILSILDDNTYLELSLIAHNLNMGILTEISNSEELNRAIALKAKVIGINNRNLKDLSIDLNRTKKLSIKIPKGTIIISESGINNYQQILDLRNYVNGFLIGSSLMKEPILNIAINRLLFGDNKVCGLTRSIDANFSMNLGAIYGGLIFIKTSPRYINLNLAYELINNSKIFYVGVFQNETYDKIVSIAKSLSLYAVQLHGHEDQNYINQLRILLPKKCQIWKVLNMNNLLQIPFNNFRSIDRYILDNNGGSGKTFNWSILKGLNLNKFMLAGGITIENCLEASFVGCIGLDLNSGFEILPGIKDHSKLTKAFQILRI